MTEQGPAITDDSAETEFVSDAAQHAESVSGGQIAQFHSQNEQARLRREREAEEHAAQQAAASARRDEVNEWLGTFKDRITKKKLPDPDEVARAETQQILLNAPSIHLPIDGAETKASRDRAAKARADRLASTAAAIDAMPSRLSADQEARRQERVAREQKQAEHDAHQAHLLESKPSLFQAELEEKRRRAEEPE